MKKLLVLILGVSFISVALSSTGGGGGGGGGWGGGGGGGEGGGGGGGGGDIIKPVDFVSQCIQDGQNSC